MNLNFYSNEKKNIFKSTRTRKKPLTQESLIRQRTLELRHDVLDIALKRSKSGFRLFCPSFGYRKKVAHLTGISQCHCCPNCLTNLKLERPSVAIKLRPTVALYRDRVFKHFCGTLHEKAQPLTVPQLICGDCV